MKIKRVTRKLLAAHKKFQANVNEFVESLGGVADEREGYKLKLETPIGTLLIHCFENWIACRFMDVDKAYEWTRKNCSYYCRSDPGSGKWNYHFADDIEILESFGESSSFCIYLNRLMNAGEENEVL